MENEMKDIKTETAPEPQTAAASVAETPQTTPQTAAASVVATPQTAAHKRKCKGADSLQLCWSCRRTCCAGDKQCPWAFDGTPVEGWKATPSVVHEYSGDDIKSYKIEACPMYLEDPLYYESTSTRNKKMVELGSMFTESWMYANEKVANAIWKKYKESVEKIMETKPFEYTISEKILRQVYETNEVKVIKAAVKRGLFTIRANTKIYEKMSKVYGEEWIKSAKGGK